MPKVIKQGPSELPPAGYARDEEMARRTDTLAEAAETQANQNEVHAIDPRAFQPINEIQQAIDPETNELTVSNPDPAYVYCWVNAGFHGLFVKLKLAQKFEVVQGEMAEAIEHRGIAADTTRRVGDTILMRIRKDHYRVLRKKQAEDADRRMGSVTSGLRDLGEKYRDKGVIVKTFEDGTMDDRTMQRMANRAQAAQTGQRVMDKWIKNGTVPGAPAPGTT